MNSWKRADRPIPDRITKVNSRYVLIYIYFSLLNRVIYSFNSGARPNTNKNKMIQNTSMLGSFL